MATAETRPYAFLDGRRAVIIPLTPDDAQKWANIVVLIAEGRLRIGELEEDATGNITYLGKRYEISRLLLPKGD